MARCPAKLWMSSDIGSLLQRDTNFTPLIKAWIPRIADRFGFAVPKWPILSLARFLIPRNAVCARSTRTC